MIASCARGPVRDIASEEEFVRRYRESAGGLVVFDLWSETCYPCRVLKPILEEVARKSAGRAMFYRVNADKLPYAANVIGEGEEKIPLPYVAFVRGGKVLYKLTGVQSKHLYQRAVDTYAAGAVEVTGTLGGGGGGP